METAFILTAQLLGNPMRLTATWNGDRVIVQAPGVRRSARDLAHAVSLARAMIGLFLRRAEDAEGCWGLHVSVGAISAAYGESPIPLGPLAPPSRGISELAKLHRRWRLQDGPRAALDNALAVIELVLTRGRQAA